MTYERANAIRSLVLNAATFTDIQGSSVMPIACNSVSILNLSGIVLTYRSDPANANSEMAIGDGQLFDIGQSTSNGATQYRFPFMCSAVGALKAASGTPSALILSVI